MPKVLKSLCLIHFWVNPFFSFPAPALPVSVAIDNWTPSMKIKKMEIFWNKISSTVCKWSSLNAPGTETPVSQPLLSESLFSYPAPLSGVIRNWTSQYKGQEGKHFLGKNQLNRLQMVQFECLNVRNTCFSSNFQEFHFPIFYPRSKTYQNQRKITFRILPNYGNIETAI